MDGQPPPGGFYGQPKWENECQEDNGEQSFEPFNDFSLTNSQAQTLEELISGNAGFEQPAPHYDSSFVQHDQGTFNSGFGLEPTFASIDPLTGHFHQSVSCPEIGVHQHIHTSLSAGSLNVVPPMDNWTGLHNFTVEFSKAQDKTKATPWIFSTKLGKLFVSMDKACPITFKVDAHPNSFSTFRIRGQIVYSRAEDYKDIVERCINHQQKDPPQSLTAAHVLRCEDKDSHYVIQEDRRHSVIVPLKTPPPGNTSVILCFRFMCLSSCIGSLNRRPTKLIFTLETLSGEPVGRYVCDVRICSCPGRDIKGEEDKISTEETANPADQHNLIPIYLPPAGVSKGKTKKRKAAPVAPLPTTNTTVDDNELYTFTVQIRGRQQYQLVRDLVNRLLGDPLLGNNSSENSSVDQNNGVKRFKEEP